jgi:hypothetical protein
MGLWTQDTVGDLFGCNTAWVASIGLLFAGTPGPSDGIGDRLSTKVGARTAITYTVNEVSYRKTAKARTSINVNGQAGEATGVAQASIVVYLTTQVRSDHGRSRWWLPPFTFDTVDGGAPGGLTIDHVVNGTSAALRHMISAGYRPVLVNKKTGVPESILGLMIPNRISTLESRAFPPVTTVAAPETTFVTL